MSGLFLGYGYFWGAAFLSGLFLLRALLFAGGAQAWVRSSRNRQSRLVVRQPRTQWRREAGRGVLILLFDALVVTAFVHRGWYVVDHHPAWHAPLILAAWLFVVFEVYFYFLHRALHHPRLFWIHRFHHQGHGTTAWTSVSFSFAERSLLLLGAMVPPALLSHWTPLSLEGLGLYFLVNFLLNVYGHMNSELVPAWFSRSPLSKWMNTSVGHGLHHLRYKGHYGLFTRHLDRWLGTDFPDYLERLDAVIAGKGAEKLKDSRYPAAKGLPPVPAVTTAAGTRQ